MKFMAQEDSQRPVGRAKAQWFPTTHWSVIDAAAREQGGATSLTALERLCQTYWYPIYAYARHQGNTAADSEDLTQGFFARFLEQKPLATVRRERGKFRSYLLTAFKNFLVNEWKHANAKRRGGGDSLGSLDAKDFEERYQLEAIDRLTPEALYERRWALAALDEVHRRLQLEYESTERADVFARLQGFLTGDRSDTTYAVLAAECGTSEGAVKVAVHRMRKRYGEILRQEIARTVHHPDDIEPEIRHLISVITQSGSGNIR